MSEFKHINEFRKATLSRKISEDPTYLSFFFMFDYVDREHSPLLSGPAEEYLKNFVDAPMGGTTNYASKLASFIKVLKKINKEMPWFWQKITGLEATQTFGTMEEPWRGAEKPKISIECLEENIELTALGLMTLYKSAVYDYNRFIEVLPKNLRHFRVWTVLSEVRTFQQTKEARDTNSRGKQMYKTEADKPISIIPRAGSETSITPAYGEFDDALTKNYTAEAKPHLMIELGQCEWQQDEIASMFADFSKTPELKKPKISFTYQTCLTTRQKFGPNIAVEDGGLLTPRTSGDDLYPNNPFDPLAIAQNAISDKVNGIAGGLVNRFNNLKDSLPGQGNNPMGRVYPDGLTGAAKILANTAMDKLKGLLLGNIHGGVGLSDINSALEAGSINAIANLAGQVFNQPSNNSNSGKPGISPQTIYEPGVDSSPDNYINEKVYDPIADLPDSYNITPGRIYEPGVDSSPDDNLNDNVHS